MKHKNLFFPALLLLLACCASLLIGSAGLPLSRILGAVRGLDTGAATILFQLRLPRLGATLLAGAGLATAGLLLQTVTSNDLCAPGIIGVNSGAGFAVMSLLCLAPAQWRLLPLAAFGGALATTTLILTLTRRSRSWRSRSTIVLAGVAVSSIFSAGISFLSLKYPDALASYVSFSVGGFSGIDPQRLVIPAGMILSCFLIALVLAPRLSLLQLGDEAAGSLGISVTRLRVGAILLSSALCAAVVSFAGLLGFVGLVAPHIVRRLVQAPLRTRLPYAALTGALLTTLSDLVGRACFTPGELPAGLIMSFLGAPFFLYLLVRKEERV